MAHEETRVKRGAQHFLFGTVLSRASGFLRDLATAFFLGTHPVLASFMIAFRFAHLLRRLIGEARLGNAFIPHFEALRKSDPHEGARFVRDLFFSAGSVVILGILLLEAGLMAFSGEIAQLTMLMLPGLLFICLFALGGGILQCEGKFLLAGAAPIAFNVVWIAVVCSVPGEPPHIVYVLAIGVTLALGLQWAVTLPKTLSLLKESLKFKELLRPRFFPKEVRALLPPLLLASLGLGAEQLGAVIDALFARAASLEGPAYLWYAIRIEQLPLSLFAIAYATSLLPSLSRTLLQGDTQGGMDLVRFSLRRSFAYVFPATLALLVLGLSAINLLYGHGHFTSSAVQETTKCLWGYALGLVPSSWVVLLAAPFFAVKDFWTPARISLIAVFINSTLNALFIFGFGLGAASVALSTGMTSFVNAILLLKALRARFPEAGGGWWTPLLRISSVTVCAALLTLIFGAWFMDDQTLPLLLAQSITLPTAFTDQLSHFALMGATFVGLLFALALWFRADDLLEIVGISKK